MTNNIYDIILAFGTLSMAIGTFLMAYITYRSYKNLANLQKASLEPILSVSLWEEVSQVPITELGYYRAMIKNDGHGIAKNVKLIVNWASQKKPEGVGSWSYEFKEEDLSRQFVLKVGNIASKEKLDISLSRIPKLVTMPVDEVYGIKIKVTCEDILGNRMEKYSDTKKMYLSDAKIKKLE